MVAQSKLCNPTSTVVMCIINTKTYDLWVYVTYDLWVCRNHGNRAIELEHNDSSECYFVTGDRYVAWMSTLRPPISVDHKTYCNIVVELLLSGSFTKAYIYTYLAQLFFHLTIARMQVKHNEKCDMLYGILPGKGRNKSIHEKSLRGRESTHPVCLIGLGIGGIPRAYLVFLVAIDRFNGAVYIYIYIYSIVQVITKMQ